MSGGYITIHNGKSKGRATKYWVLRKPDKKSPFKPLSKPDKISAKPDNLSLKAPPNVTPNNIITNNINKDVFSNHFPILKAQLLDLGAIYKWNRQAMEAHLLKDRYTRSQIEEAFDKYAHEKGKVDSSSRMPKLQTHTTAHRAKRQN